MTDEKVVALTFDDGPHPTLTREILCTLEKYDARATFFIVGENAKNYPDVLRMALDAGHEIGNHTYSHKTLGGCSARDIEREISEAEDEILSVCGTRTRVLRPPEGRCSAEAADVAETLGYTVILWNIDTRDWAHKSTADIVANIKKNLRPGSIILFHDYVSGVSHTGEALGIILPFLQSEGYSFVTVSELLEK